MHLIRKIKSYFLRYEFYSWKDFSLDSHEIKFRHVDDDHLLEIGSFIKSNLRESSQIGNNRHRLKEAAGIACRSLDDLLPLLKDIINTDYRETLGESIEYRWDFQYFVSEHKHCKNTICVSTALRSIDSQNGNCVYPLASVRKYKGSYYCWNHLD